MRRRSVGFRWKAATVNYVRSIDTGMLTRTELKTPQRRECECCGRREVWDDRGGWRIATENDENDTRAVGNPHCIHEWDIDGAFRPFE